ncbi:uncharacterized protein N7477_003552 [Penicillium maclennaniae]|uniref:uncharacterized protein n=1 Tax=Penicillium maclennaniae TaxID=1343394 RepID=UPI002541E597|nr:uncharacterized protein N7477_003552 [Penicillium maclennaniae]KAJ5677919.1 hypothetical protein N7477_003552 [Penicillium maclennaniae]
MTEALYDRYCSGRTGDEEPGDRKCVQRSLQGSRDILLHFWPVLIAKRATDPTWRAFEDRTFSKLLQIDTETDTDKVGEYVDEFDDWQEFQAVIPDLDKVI